jgi:predicted phage terminase large subunit-like protein
MKLKERDILMMALQVQADECRKSFFYFVKTFWDVIIKEKPVYNWHIEYLCTLLQEASLALVKRAPKKNDIIINIPPGSTKSTITTIMYPAWLWTQDPSLRIITNSYSGTLSIEHAVKSKDIILSDKFRMLFPEIEIRKDKSAKGMYENTLTGSRYVTSTGGTVTGFHAHVIINDDPQNPKQANSDVLRLAANEHTKTLSSRKVSKSVAITITIMQRLHEDDVTGYLLKKKEDSITHICLPAEVSEKVKPAFLKEKYIDGLLDPMRINRQVLDEAKTDLGSQGYSGQYDQSPFVEGGNIIKRDWFRKISFSSFMAIKGNTEVHFFIDTAYDEKKKKTDNDPSGIIATCKIHNCLYIIHGQKVYKEFPDLIRFIPEYASTHGYDKRSTIRIEPKANGKSVVHQLKEVTSLNITETPSPTDSKSTRLKAKSPKIECGRVVLVEGEWNEEFIDEVCGFPTKTHDEHVDLLTYAIDYHLEYEIEIPDYLTKESFGL